MSEWVTAVLYCTADNMILVSLLVYIIIIYIVVVEIEVVS
jgi:hypothetical protein